MGKKNSSQLGACDWSKWHISELGLRFEQEIGPANPCCAAALWSPWLSQSRWYLSDSLETWISRASKLQSGPSPLKTGGPQCRWLTKRLFVLSVSVYFFVRDIVQTGITRNGHEDWSRGRMLELQPVSVFVEIIGNSSDVRLKEHFPKPTFNLLFKSAKICLQFFWKAELVLARREIGISDAQLVKFANVCCPCCLLYFCCFVVV